MGSEVPSNRLILESMNAKHMSISYWRLKQRGLPKTKKYLLKNYFPEDTLLYVHAGVPRNIALDRLEFESLAAEYEEFIADNIDRIAMFSEMTHPLLSPDFIEEQRKTCWAQCPPGKFLPIWNPNLGQGELRRLADTYLDIGLTGESIEEFTWLAGVTRSLTTQSGTRFHAIACARPDNLRQVPVETAHSLAWISPMTHGETIVWDGVKLARYPKSMKAQARPRYKAIYESIGLDFDKIVGDDEKENCKLAIWSFQRLEEKLSKMANLYDNFEDPASDDYAEKDLVVPDNKPLEVGKLMDRDPSEMTVLPVFNMSTQKVFDPDGTIKDVPVVESSGASVRQCNTCFIAANCPAFKANNSCAYSFPIELKTREQLQAYMTAILELQSNRVAFAAFTEQVNGGYPDPNVSKELDRLIDLTQKINDMLSGSSSIKMTVEAKNAGAGWMTRMFGDRAQVLNELPKPIDEVETTRILKDLTED